MKLILCGKCFDIRALRDTGPVTCECGNVTGWWLDPDRGTGRIYAKDRDRAKLVGINNHLILTAFKAYDYSPARWREIHDEICRNSKGYVFHTDQRNCPVAIAGVGSTSDVTWADEPPQGKST